MIESHQRVRWTKKRRIRTMENNQLWKLFTQYIIIILFSGIQSDSWDNCEISIIYHIVFSINHIPNKSEFINIKTLCVIFIQMIFFKKALIFWWEEYQELILLTKNYKWFIHVCIIIITTYIIRKLIESSFACFPLNV